MDLNPQVIRSKDRKVPFFISFVRSQIGAICATSVDMLSLFALTEWAGIYYVYSAGIASALGAVTSFLLLRYWAFESTEHRILGQAGKYAVVSGLILLLNMGGIYLFTDLMGLQYMLSKVIIASLIGIFVSFPLFCYWVYR